MNARDTTYSISELARHFDVTPRTIRFYEDQGLLSPQRIDTQRLYHERDFVRLKLILRGKRIGFSLAELKETLDLYDTEFGESAQTEYVLKIIDAHRRELEQRQQDIAVTLQEMQTIEDRIRDNMKK